MRLVNPSAWVHTLGLYIVIGMICGTGWAEWIATSWMGRAGFGTAAMINVLMPLEALAVAAYHPRFRTAILGGFLMMAGYIAGALFRVDHNPFEWTFLNLRDHTQPIEAAAAIGYAVVGCFGVLAVSPWRRVAAPRIAGQCACGYALAGMGAGPCPECGTPQTQNA